MKKSRKILALILALASVFALCACGSSAKPESTLDRIISEGRLTMATDATWAPFEYLGPNGEPDGVDIELAKYIADQLGVELEVRNAEFETLPTYIANGEADMIISSISVTEERKETIAFSIPYVIAEQYIVFSADDTSERTVNGLAGKAIGVELGTTGDFLVSDEISSGCLAGTGAEVKQFMAIPDAYLSMQNGELGAIVCDTLMAENLCTLSGGSLICFPLVFADGSTTTEEYAIGMAKGDDAFVAKVNEIIAPIIEDGTVDAWIAEHTEISSNID